MGFALLSVRCSVLSTLSSAWERRWWTDRAMRNVQQQTTRLPVDSRCTLVRSPLHAPKKEEKAPHAHTTNNSHGLHNAARSPPIRLTPLFHRVRDSLGPANAGYVSECAERQKRACDRLLGTFYRPESIDLTSRFGEQSVTHLI